MFQTLICNSLNPYNNHSTKNKYVLSDVPGGPVVKSPSCNARDTGLILGWGEIPTCHGAIEPACHNQEDYMLQMESPSTHHKDSTAKKHQTNKMSFYC